MKDGGSSVLQCSREPCLMLMPMRLTGAVQVRKSLARMLLSAEMHLVLLSGLKRRTRLISPGRGDDHSEPLADAGAPWA